MADNQTIVIDIVARLKDETSANIATLVNNLNNGLNAAQTSVNNLNTTFSTATVNVDTLNQAITTVQQNTDTLGNTASSTQNDINGLSDSFNGAQRNAAGLGTSINNTRTRSDRFVASMRRTEQQAHRLTRDRWIMRLEAVDRTAQSISKVTNSVSKFANKTFSFTMKMTDLATKPLQGLFKMAANPIVALGSVAGVTFGVKDTVDTFANFEHTIANVRAITKSSMSDFKELRETAMHLGETTVFSAAEVAQGMTYLGMAGWEKDSIKEAMPGLLDLSVAGQTDLATTSDIISDVMTAFNLDPTLKTKKGIANTTHVADVFATTVTGSNTDVTMLGETMKYAAPIAREFNMTLEETAAISGMMANAGKDFCSVTRKLVA